MALKLIINTLTRKHAKHTYCALKKQQTHFMAV